MNKGKDSLDLPKVNGMAEEQTHALLIEVRLLTTALDQSKSSQALSTKRKNLASS